MMTGTSGRSALALGSSSRPLIPGMLMSERTKSEFAGRHMLYEKFYAGSSIVVRNQNDREAPWERFHGIVDRLLDEIEVPAADKDASKR